MSPLWRSFFQRAERQTLPSERLTPPLAEVNGSSVSNQLKQSGLKGLSTYSFSHIREPALSRARKMFVHTPRRSRRKKNVDFGFRNIVDLNSCWKSTNPEDDVCCFSLSTYSIVQYFQWGRCSVGYFPLPSITKHITSHHSNIWGDSRQTSYWYTLQCW